MVGTTDRRALSRARAHLFFAFVDRADIGTGRLLTLLDYSGSITQGLGVGDGGDGSCEGK